MNRSFERVVAFAGDFSPLLALHALVPTVAQLTTVALVTTVALPLSHLLRTLSIPDEHGRFL